MQHESTNADDREMTHTNQQRNMKNLNDLAKRIHEGNKKWWVDLDTGLPIERNKGELLRLVITELAEAVEGIRKNLMDDKLPHRKMEEVEMADAFIRLLDFAGGFGIELTFTGCAAQPRLRSNKAEHILIICKQVCSAHNHCLPPHEIGRARGDVCDAIALIIDYCAVHNLDLEGAIEEKLAYNATREDHTIEARKLANGKKF